MKTSSEIRLSNFRLLLAEAGSAASLARLTGVPAAYISQIKNGIPNESGKPRTIGDDTARKMERGMGKKEGWMDADHTSIMFGSLDPMESQLVALFRVLPQDDRDEILRFTNNIVSAKVHRTPSPANPYPNIPKLPPLPAQLTPHHPGKAHESKKRGSK